MKKIGKSSALIAFLFFGLVFCFQNASAETSVRAMVDRNQLGIGDPLTLIVTVQSDESFEIPLPQLPKLTGIEELNSSAGMRSTTSSMSMINGKTQFSSKTQQDFQYLLSPQKEGKLLIPVIDIMVNGKTYKTQPITIEVKEEFRNSGNQNAGKPRGKFPPGYGEDDSGGDEEQNDMDLFDQFMKKNQRLFGGGLPPGFPPGFPGGGQGQPIPSRKLDINPNETFFVHLDVDKTEAYEGEQVTANWYIYTKSQIDSLDRVKFPDLKGFWKEIIEEVPALQFTEEIVNGEHYRKALLASHALFPIKAGTSVVDEFRIKAKIRNLTQFGWGRSQVVTKASKRTPIKVLPLPQDGKTQGFSGAVGSYRVTLKTDGLSFPANQPFTIKVRYEGIGNAKLIELPAIAWPEGLELYDTKSEAKFFKEGNSYKEFEILVIPRKEGELKIPSIQFTYFDPSQKKYLSQATDELTVQITPGNPNLAGTTSSTSSGIAKNADAFVAQPILQLPEYGFNLASQRLSIYGLVFLCGLIFSLLHFVRDFKKFSGGANAAVQMEAKMQLIEKYQKQNDLRKIGSESTNLIYLIVAHLAGQQKADQELHILMKEIPLRDQQKYLDSINRLFDYFQLLGFSPDEIMRSAVAKTPTNEAVAELSKLTKEVVDKLRKAEKNNS